MIERTRYLETDAEVAGFAASHPGERPPIGLTVGSDPMAILPSDNGVPFLPKGYRFDGDGNVVHGGTMIFIR